MFSRDVVSPHAHLPAAELAAMPLDGSLYEPAGAARSPPSHHGIVTVEPPCVRTGRCARRLKVKTGELLLFLRQVDYGTDGEPLLLSHEYHLADAFEFSVVRRGPGRRSLVTTTSVGKAMRLKRVDRSGGRLGDLRARPRDDVADVPGAARGHHARAPRETIAGGANVIMMSKGMIRVAQRGVRADDLARAAAVGEREPDGDRPEIVQIAEVEEALVLGADAVVLFTALGGDTEAGMIDILAAVGRECAAARACRSSRRRSSRRPTRRSRS